MLVLVLVLVLMLLMLLLLLLLLVNSSLSHLLINLAQGLWVQNPNMTILRQAKFQSRKLLVTPTQYRSKTHRTHIGGWQVKARKPNFLQVI